MNPPDTTNNFSFVHRLLIEPEYRVTRHLLLVLIITVISFNQAFMTFLEGLDVLGYRIYVQTLLVLVGYMVVGYFNFFVLLPHYLLKKKYVQYTLLLAVTVFLLIVFQTIEEYYILTRFNIANESYSYPNIYLNILSSFAIVLLSLSGAAMTILLKYKLTEDEKMRQLEKRHIQSEVEQLKEQVSPHLLFNILNRTGMLAPCQPDKASDMLLRLSRLLRYQLYDCNREQVLLSAEIKFLNDYLSLEQAYTKAFRFTIREDKDASYTQVAPLLFISFVQAAIIKLYKENREAILGLSFRTTEEGIIFGCGSEPEPLFSDLDYSKIKRRLDFLYPGHYVLNVSDQHITLNLKL